MALFHSQTQRLMIKYIRKCLQLHTIKHSTNLIMFVYKQRQRHMLPFFPIKVAPTKTKLYQYVCDLKLPNFDAANMGRDARKPVFGVSDIVQLRPSCSATETS